MVLGGARQGQQSATLRERAPGERNVRVKIFPTRRSQPSENRAEECPRPRELPVRRPGAQKELGEPDAGRAPRRRLQERDAAARGEDVRRVRPAFGKAHLRRHRGQYVHAAGSGDAGHPTGKRGQILTAHERNAAESGTCSRTAGHKDAQGGLGGLCLHVMNPAGSLRLTASVLLGSVPLRVPGTVATRQKP